MIHSLQKFFLSEKNKRFLIDLFIIGLSFIIIFWNLGNSDLQVWDEFTNALVIRETNNTNSFPLLILNNQPFMEKPPLWYYLTIGLTKVLGESNFVFRAISGLSGLILLILILKFTRRQFNYSASIITVFVLFSSWQLFIVNLANTFSTHTFKSADLDILQILFTFISIIFIFKYEKNTDKKFLILSAIFGGLGFMTKGIFALIPLITWLAWLLYKKKFKEIYKDSFIYVLCFLIIVIPWHLYMYLNFGNSFIEKYFIYHNLQRTFSPLEGHGENFFFHIINLLNPFFFLSGIIFFTAIYTIYKKRFFKEFKFFYLSLYSMIILMLVSLIQTKLSWYLLQIYPTAIILSSWYISDLIIRKFHLN